MRGSKLGRRTFGLFRYGLAAAILALPASPALAIDWSVSAHVTKIESTYMPGVLVFWIDVPAGNCAPGTALTWQIQGADAPAKTANAQAVFSTLMTAMVANKVVTLFGINAPNCLVQFVHISTS